MALSRGIASACLATLERLPITWTVPLSCRAFSTALPKRVEIYEVGPRDGLQNEKELIPTSAKALPKRVEIYEVGPRDGLQNEKELIPTSVKVDLINRLTDCGFKSIEVTSFVSPKWVPQLADAAEVLKQMSWRSGVKYPVLTPNLKAGAKEVAIFGSASEAFSERNLNCSIKDSLKKFQEVVAAAHKNNVAVRGYVSCVVGCPIQGAVSPVAAADVAGALMDMGCYEVSMADTIGVGTAGEVKRMFEACLQSIAAGWLAAYMHVTYGQGLANLLASFQMDSACVQSIAADRLAAHMHDTYVQGLSYLLASLQMDSVSLSPMNQPPINPSPRAQACVQSIAADRLAAHMHDTYVQGLSYLLASLQMDSACVQSIAADRLAAHMHDTYGQGLSYLLASLQMDSVSLSPMNQPPINPSPRVQACVQSIAADRLAAHMHDTYVQGLSYLLASLQACLQSIPADKLAAHMHDTYGQGLANLLASLQMGVSVIDSSVAGLGGCPYAKGATGNVSTEDVVYMLNGMGIQHGIDMEKLLDASDMITKALGRPPGSRAATALLSLRK
eukprot:gene30571-35586_t